jgi:hypothetical protein
LQALFYKEKRRAPDEAQQCKAEHPSGAFLRRHAPSLLVSLLVG